MKKLFDNILFFFLDIISVDDVKKEERLTQEYSAKDYIKSRGL